MLSNTPKMVGSKKLGTKTLGWALAALLFAAPGAMQIAHAQDEVPAPDTAPKIEASDTPVEATVGQTYAVDLAAGEKQDFNIDLPAGSYRVIVDSKAIEGNRLFASVALLKRNGASYAPYPNDLAFWAQNDTVWRDGKKFTLPKPLGARFRLRNTHTDVAANYWLTVVAADAPLRPFDFGIPITDGTVGPNNGSGGALEHGEIAFHKFTLPKGTWSVSLGAKAAEGRAYASLLALDSLGFYNVGETTAFSLISSAGDYGAEKREEKIIKLNAERTFIFRVWNEGAGDSAPITYDVTVEPSEE
jgi:hypothetical protein